MSIDFEELDFRQTPLGDLVLRRRGEPLLEGTVVFEVKLGDAFLMSSLFTAGEVALAELALAEVQAGELDVVVGGLGLGYTAEAALAEPRVRSLVVIELFGAVIDWHRRGLVPLGEKLSRDARCRLVHGDFFALAEPSGAGFDPARPGRRFHAILLDIDHSPRHLLSASNARCYSASGLAALASRLHAGGVFALWSNDPPDAAFERTLAGVFASVRVHVVEFYNPYTNSQASCSVYVARAAQ